MATKLVLQAPVYKYFEYISINEKQSFLYNYLLCVASKKKIVNVERSSQLLRILEVIYRSTIRRSLKRNNQSASNSFDDCESKINAYLDLVATRKFPNALDFWRCHEQQFPILSQIAK